MTMANRIRELPPLPPRENAVARAVALEARNALLADTLRNFCEAWHMLRGEYPAEVNEVIEACRAA
jgi:hypothetical protein